MTSDLNIYRLAHVLICQHGEDAAIDAARRIDAMLEKGDIEGKTVWLRVLHAVEEIAAGTEPGLLRANTSGVTVSPST